MQHSKDRPSLVSHSSNHRVTMGELTRQSSSTHLRELNNLRSKASKVPLDDHPLADDDILQTAQQNSEGYNPQMDSQNTNTLNDANFKQQLQLYDEIQFEQDPKILSLVTIFKSALFGFFSLKQGLVILSTIDLVCGLLHVTSGVVVIFAQQNIINPLSVILLVQGAGLAIISLICFVAIRTAYLQALKGCMLGKVLVVAMDVLKTNLLFKSDLYIVKDKVYWKDGVIAFLAISIAYNIYYLLMTYSYYKRILRNELLLANNGPRKLQRMME